MSKTKIEWTDYRWNPTRGCSRVSAGCKNCYAERMAARFSDQMALPPFDIPGVDPDDDLLRFAEMRNGKPMWTGRVALIPERLEIPLHWRKPRRIFVDSMSDLFHENLSDADIDKVISVMALCPQHTFQVLTKRPERMLKYMTSPQRYGLLLDEVDAIRWRHTKIRLGDIGVSNPCINPPKWIHLGVSCEDQRAADERIPLLLNTPAAVRFVSLEPLLGPVDVREFVNTEPCDHIRQTCEDVGCCGTKKLDWVIVGGESGPGARSCDVAWIRSIVQQCKAARVPCFVKQLGANPWVKTDHNYGPGVDAHPYNMRYGLKDRKGGDISEWPEDLRVREFPDL